MLELKHLKTLVTLEQSHCLNKAAELLFTTQSALSHQLKTLEHRLNHKLFIRRSSPLVFTPQGKVLLALAKEVLPKVEQAEIQLSARKATKVQRMPFNFAMQCHSGFQWLLPAIKTFSGQQPALEVDLIEKSVFSLNPDSDLPDFNILLTDKKANHQEFIYQDIGTFELILALSKEDPLADKAYIQADDLTDKTLITYPLSPEQQDIFNLFLQPASCQPARLRQVENSDVILQMVEAGLGVSAIPDWLAAPQIRQGKLKSKSIGRHGISRKLYAAYRPDQAKWAEHFVPIARRQFSEFSNAGSLH
ncbi:LysR substrate-binding domain-containing protein [Thalassomonas actiniarum]|uniref:LysR family transcriptional regulator n=1 Tax=Thalassomonas actiniarum TaxID=485447 RepID=A0AAE9YRW9_9GAMM|nr:LysR substrate-binding domain-containing protein [Thalassomonas actiniarum]WDD99751.1 LysR family transcriptional regulator [Thalassomonas actiniarum]